MKYTIKKGDTLSKIATTHKTSVAEIQKANATLIKDVNKISVGWVIEIPVSEPSEKGYETIGRQVEQCLKDIQKLPSYIKLKNLL